MHRGHPARIIGAPAAPASGLPSDDTHELGGEAVDDDEDESLLGEPLPPPPPWLWVVAPDEPPAAPPRDDDDDLDRLSRSSCSFDPTLPLFLLIFQHCRTEATARVYWWLLVLLELWNGTQATSMVVCLPGYLWCGGATPVCII